MPPFDLSTAKPVEASGGFDLSSAKPVEQPTPQGSDVPTWGEMVAGSLPVRLAMGAASPFIAAAQAGAALGDLINEATGVEPVISPLISKGLKRYEEMKQRGMGGGIDAAGFVGSLYPGAKIGGAVSSKFPAAMQQATGLIPRAIIGATQGAAIGAAQPVFGDDYWMQKAAQTGGGFLSGGAVPYAATGFEKGLDFVKPHYNNFADLFRKEGPANYLSRYLQEAVGEKNVPRVNQLLRSSGELVPGSKPVASQAVAGIPEGSPIASYEKIAAGSKGGASSLFGNRLTEQRLARIKALDEIMPGVTVEQAIAKRTAATNPLYEQAYRDMVRGDTKLDILLNRPTMKEALQRADRLAKDNGEPFAWVTPGVPTGKPYKTPKAVVDYPVKSLHYIKLALDDMLNSSESTALGRSQQRAVAETKDAFVTWLTERSPSYKAARDTFADLSKDVNRAEVRDFLKDRLINPSGNETTGMYLKAIDDATASLKKATGFPRFKKLEDVLQPQEAKSARAVASDLERAYSAKHPLQPTNLQGGHQLTKESMETLPRILSRPIVITNALLGAIGKQSVEPRIDALAAQAFTNPPQLADLLARKFPNMTPQVARMMLGLQQAGQIGLPTATGQAMGK